MKYTEREREMDERRKGYKPKTIRGKDLERTKQIEKKSYIQIRTLKCQTESEKKLYEIKKS